MTCFPAVLSTLHFIKMFILSLAELPEQDDAIDAFLQKRFRGRQPDRTEIRRAADALLRRGHAWGDIRRALERYDPDLPEE